MVGVNTSAPASSRCLRPGKKPGSIGRPTSTTSRRGRGRLPRRLALLADQPTDDAEPGVDHRAESCRILEDRGDVLEDDPAPGEVDDGADEAGDRLDGQGGAPPSRRRSGLVAPRGPPGAAGAEYAGAGSGAGRAGGPGRRGARSRRDRGGLCGLLPEGELAEGRPDQAWVRRHAAVALDRGDRDAEQVAEARPGEPRSCRVDGGSSRGSRLVVELPEVGKRGSGGRCG